ncbi:hypothetical protein [Nostoc sp.]|uniref:hypothetical protein n=1 Tax=Nostoc sp. TaxID=1180 RepID=UPI002FF8BA8F
MRKDGWIDYTDFTFTLKAPIAHLPVCWLRQGGLGAFFSRVETCYLPNPTFTIQLTLVTANYSYYVLLLQMILTIKL